MTCPLCGLSSGIAGGHSCWPKEQQLERWVSNQMQEQPASTGTKHDDGKPMPSYLPANAVLQVAAVMTFGAKKYGPFNYLKGIAYTRLIAAGLRHAFAILRGEWTDEESGLPHYAHAAACFLMLGEMHEEKPEMNDLHKGGK